MLTPVEINQRALSLAALTSQQIELRAELDRKRAAYELEAKQLRAKLARVQRRIEALAEAIRTGYESQGELFDGDEPWGTYHDLLPTGTDHNQPTEVTNVRGE